MPSSYVKMLTRSLVLFLCLSLAPAAPVKRNTSAEEGNGVLFINGDHHNKCSHLISNTTDSCHFYTECIEPYFTCEEPGFALGYARKRCIALSVKSENITQSFNSETLQSWVHDHEICLRKKLLLLVKNFSADGPSDKPTCINFENSAFSAVRECYNDTLEKFCSFESPDLEGVTSDVLHIRDLFSLNNSLYYNYTINQGLVELLNSCELAVTSNVSQLLKQHYPRREVICAHHSQDISPGSYIQQDYIKNISKLLNIPQEQLVYSDTELSSELKSCFGEAKSYVANNAYRVHVILWSVPPSTEVVYENLNRDTYYGKDSLETWPARPYSRSGQCGDGLRQATETCDTGIYSGQDFGCSADCLTLEGFECHGERLQKTQCKPRECGNEAKTRDEKCDDGNTKDGDGCSSMCTVEEGWECSVQKSRVWSTSQCSKTPSASSPSPSPSPSPLLSSLPTPSPSSSSSPSTPLSSSSPTTPTRGAITPPTESLSTSLTALIIVGTLVGGFVCISALILAAAVICSCSSRTTGTDSDKTQNQTKTAVIEYTESPSLKTSLSASTSSSSDNISQPQLQLTME